MKLQLALTIALTGVLGALSCRWDGDAIQCFQGPHCQGPRIQGLNIQNCLGGGPALVFGCFAQWGTFSPNPDEEELYNCVEDKWKSCYVDYAPGTVRDDKEKFEECLYYALKDVPCEKFAAKGSRENEAIHRDCEVVNGPHILRRLEGSLPKCFGQGDGPLNGAGSLTCNDEADNNAKLCVTPMDPASGNRGEAFHSNEITLKAFKVNAPGEKVKFIKILILQCNVWVGGEPHIKKWDGSWYDWQGECDSVLLNVPDYGYGMGLAVHARTKIRYDYSFIETAAIQIGDDILEISGFGNYFLNGVNQAELPAAISSNHFLSHEKTDEDDHKYTIDLGKGISLSVKTHKDIVSVGVDVAYGADGHAFKTWFSNSTGLMGSFPAGEMLARDGRVLTDPNEMGQEWQVLDTEPKLFQVQDRQPQYPNTCRLPSDDALQTHRRLGETVSQEAAKTACSSWGTEDAKNRCIFDVIATGDLTMALAGSY